MRRNFSVVVVLLLVCSCTLEKEEILLDPIVHEDSGKGRKQTSPIARLNKELYQLYLDLSGQNHEFTTSMEEIDQTMGELPETLQTVVNSLEEQEQYLEELLQEKK